MRHQEVHAGLKGKQNCKDNLLATQMYACDRARKYTWHRDTTLKKKKIQNLNLFLVNFCKGKAWLLRNRRLEK